MKAQNLPNWNSAADSLTHADWMVQPIQTKAQIFTANNGKDLVMYNGLLKRVFRIAPNMACTDFTNLSNGQQLLRAVAPEAKLIIDGTNYNIGGLYGQKEKAYLLNNWVDNFTTDAGDFQYQSYSISPLQPYLNRKTGIWSGTNTTATGKTIAFEYASKNPVLANVVVTVHYSLYDGLPLLIKWLTVTNNGNHAITINRVVNEVLAFVEEESAVVGTPEQMKKQHGIYVETNYAFNNAMRYDISDQTTHWKTDSTYTSQVNYNYQTPCVLEVYPEKVNGIILSPGESFSSPRTHELLMDSYDRERRGLAIRKMYRAVAPWTNENPIFMHLVSRNNNEVKQAIDQCAATGYEALILSFGSHCNMEDTSAANIAQWKILAAYAHEKHILIGGYSLFSSRKISDADDVIDPVTSKPDAGAFFGNAPCMGSNWGLAYIQKLKYFISQTGFNIFENDGPYPGDVCASTQHPGHKGLDDSQWKQMELQKGLYHWCNENGIYVNAPDWYFLDGTNKIAIGYREVNFSLSREQQMILNRQNIYDGLWEKTPSMSWGFVPLTKYQGGGPEAVLEPLSEHLKDYQQLMMQYYGAGVQACYRGPRLYDTDATKTVVSNTISWYKQYRDILNADIIHLRRADGRDWDGILHVNPQLSTKGLLLLYNPLQQAITRTITVPLYYTGLTKTARIRQQGGAAKTYTLNRNYNIQITVTIAAESYTWFTVE
ncbi:alpha-galactosidase [Panacibacter sp. KCS-6]|uniref:Alpha-galactosidase n=1 Tax=Limnovirga soli TaxID=2656915 RepID=A0A8J8JU56_9BACT|nr:alpha-galactosidase [Limnovirga soli]